MVATKLMTAEELSALPDDGYQYELVRGELRRMPPPKPEHGYVCMRLSRWLASSEEAGDFTVFGNDSGVTLERNPDTVRGPDVAVYRNGDLPPRPWTSYFAIPPVLAGEVASPGDAAAEIEEKIDDYRRAGVPLIVYCFPHQRIVWVDGAGRERIVLHENDLLDVSDALPGLAPIAVAKLFR
ncbi:MAG TPA: Uma2 family endonuclease [Thermomicrobiales bacterium]|jgi:Uma2 family endonuclease